MKNPQSLPDKATKHITRPQDPIGAQKNKKLKVLDGDTQKVSWRQGRVGFSKDFDGDPIAENKNKGRLKPRPKHSARMGKEKKHTAHMGGREGAYSGDE